MAPLQFSSGATRSMNSGSSPQRASNVAGAGGVLGAINIPLLLVVVALVAVGLVTLHSVTVTSTRYSFNRQLISIAVGVVVCIAVWIIDFRRIQKGNAAVFVMLALVLFLVLLPMTPLGFEANGARSWVRLPGLGSFQPSELAKPIAILMMATYVSRFGGSIDRGVDFLKCIGLLLIPVALLAKDDLGTGLVILIIGFVIIFVGGANMRWVLVTIMVGVVAVSGLLVANSVISNWTGGEVKLVKDYQMSRLLVFIDQDNPDYAEDAYNLNQAKIAIGSGEISGKGWGNASQSNGGFLPESATDFIFCVYAEQTGFIGSVILLFLYLALLAAALAIGIMAGNTQGSLIVAGIMGMWLFQVIENIGMDIGLMPITGIPLPFMSYGGSFMITNFICVGMLMSVWMHRGAVSLPNRRG